MPTKADTAQSQERTRKAIECILKHNFSRREWVQYCAKQYEISDRQADKYWSFANQHIIEKWTKKKDTLVEEHYGRLFDLYEKAVNAEEWNVARLCLQDLSKLTGINEPEKKDITSDGESIKIVIGVDNDD